MEAPVKSEQMIPNGSITLELEPDILTLGEYMAQRSGMSLESFIEYLITKEAANGKHPGAF